MVRPAAGAGAGLKSPDRGRAPAGHAGRSRPDLPLSFSGERGHQAMREASQQTHRVPAPSEDPARLAFAATRSGPPRQTEGLSYPRSDRATPHSARTSYPSRSCSKTTGLGLPASLLAGRLWSGFAGRVFPVRPAEPGALSPLSHRARLAGRDHGCDRFARARHFRLWRRFGVTWPPVVEDKELVAVAERLEKAATLVSRTPRRAPIEQ